ncbi:hypothetical protein H5410_013032 [Solanum commersonii]|uniref:Uncharacterized protein n=1 Tax=Solanum commersonii TaxID=4109 RepID=A0A9J6ATD3_SOLCO|nr:hypothetical protein H5410_013032 [Solanum commersonii]
MQQIGIAATHAVTLLLKIQEKSEAPKYLTKSSSHTDVDEVYPTNLRRRSPPYQLISYRSKFLKVEISWGKTRKEDQPPLRGLNPQPPLSDHTTRSLYHPCTAQKAWGISVGRPRVYGVLGVVIDRCHCMIAEESMNNNTFDEFSSADKHRRLPIRLSIVSNHNNQKGFSQKNKEGIAVASPNTK